MDENCNRIWIMKAKALIQRLEKEKTTLMGQLINKYHNEEWNDVSECSLKLSEIAFAIKVIKETFKEELEYRYEME